MPTRLRRLAAAAALAAASLAVTGCLNIVDEHAAQQDGIGHVVRITATVCLDGADANSCDTGDAAPGRYQGLLAVRVPAGVTGPATTVAKRAEGDITLTADPVYAAELERIQPAGAGMQWLGYVAAPVDVPVSFPTPEPGGEMPTPDLRLSPSELALDVTLPAGPLPASLRYQLVPGYRPVNDELPADRAVACPAPDAVDPDTFCLDPFDDSVLATFHDLALNDVVIAAPTVGDVTPGTTVTLPFTAAFTGTPAGPLALAASTDLPGATATPGSQALAPGEQAAPVALAIPAASGARPLRRHAQRRARQRGPERDGGVHRPAGHDQAGAQRRSA